MMGTWHTSKGKLYSPMQFMQKIYFFSLIRNQSIT